MSRATEWAAVSAMVGALFGAPIDWLKNALTFHPNTAVSLSPAAYGLPYEDVWFGGPDGRSLHGWYIPAPPPTPGETEVLFLWFHGNAGNVSHRLSHLRMLYAGVRGSHFLFDYSGFGNSRGRPTIPGAVADSRDAVAVVHARGWAKDKRVVYFGESLGAAFVVALAVETPPDRAILLAPFYSLRAMGDLRLPFLAFLAENDLNSARAIGNLRAPLLVIHGTRDWTVPFRQGQDLYALAPPPKQFYAVEGAGHNNVHEVGGETYLRVIREFVLGPAS
jgi:fermentation-respiration switch protein FrsA (DUF1100 family)